MTSKGKIWALILGWLIPGAGHYYLGYKWKGIAICALLCMVYFAGMAIAGFRNVNFQEPLYMVGYSFAGGMTIVSLCATAHLPVANSFFQSYRLGCLYTTIASLLNALAMLQLCSIPLSEQGIEENTVQ